MLKGIRVVITAYTASFCAPGMLGYQLTLPVPPLSAIYGLLSAAAGRWVAPNKVEWLAYRFEYEWKATDLETIITFERKTPDDIPTFAGRNVIKREFLSNPRLTLYLPECWEQFLRRPRYSLLLGRTQDVACVESIEPVQLQPVDEGMLSGVLLPWEVIQRGNVDAWLQSLPITFSDGAPRRPLGKQIFGVLDAHRRPSQVNAPDWLAQDPIQNHAVPVYRWEWIRNVLQRTSG
ncbi:MAG: type I-B CRISPR-associated protein Cas5b [Armatimonadetes bacterium]|nr:type I-B CRISPR-associated protein Cas5b [Armatimonadota bacterium]